MSWPLFDLALKDSVTSSSPMSSNNGAGDKTWDVFGLVWRACHASKTKANNATCGPIQSADSRFCNGTHVTADIFPPRMFLSLKSVYRRLGCDTAFAVTHRKRPCTVALVGDRSYSNAIIPNVLSDSGPLGSKTPRESTYDVLDEARASPLE